MTSPWWILIISAATGNDMFYPKICLRTYNSPISIENMKKYKEATRFFHQMPNKTVSMVHVSWIVSLSDT
jgi:hypothetical protein